MNLHKGLPVLPARVTGRNPDHPHMGLITTDRCPCCRQRHHHGDDLRIGVGTFTHRAAHCATNKPDGGYYLLIVENRFAAVADIFRLDPREGQRWVARTDPLPPATGQ